MAQPERDMKNAVIVN